MTARPWMPLYIADYLADTAHLGALQSGAYLHLIMHYWQTGGLPDDEAALMRIARLTVAEWRRNQAIIGAFFHGGWHHKRIDAELAHAADVSSKRRASAEQRHNKSSANAPANAEQLDTHARGLSQSPSPSQQGEGKKPSLRSGYPRVPRAKATRIPDGYQPDLSEAIALGIQLERAITEAAKFRDYFAGAPGQRGLKLDWPATWRNWCRKAAEDHPRAGTGPPGRRRVVNGFAAHALDLMDSHDEPGNRPPNGSAPGPTEVRPRGPGIAPEPNLLDAGKPGAAHGPDPRTDRR